MRVVETLLVFSMAAVYFPIMAWRIWTDQFVMNSQSFGFGLEQGFAVPLGVGKPVSELTTVIHLDTFDEGEDRKLDFENKETTECIQKNRKK